MTHQQSISKGRSDTSRRVVEPLAAALRPDPFRPSEYTGLLIHVLRTRAQAFGRGAGLDMGMGSGVLLGIMGSLGVERLFGVDIDPEAIRASQHLVQALGLSERTRLLRGSLWEPLGSDQFDVVVANLPNFAATEPSDPDHSRFWSMGGADGRQLIDPFIAGLRPHLRDSGVAFMTHNALAGIAQTEAILARHGLTSRTIQTTTTVLHPMKSALLNQAVRAKSLGVTLTSLGPYEFTDVHVLEIRPTLSA
jgi:release factor glutamine methyltransferase